MQDTALLVVDVQCDFFTSQPPVNNGSHVLAAVRDLIARARHAHYPVVFIQHDGGEGDPLHAGLPGWELHPDIRPMDGETVIVKTTPDSFHDTPLDSILKAWQIKKLVIAGFQTEVCINATCRRAHDLGYHVLLVSDAHTTYDDGGTLAPQVVARYNEALRPLAQPIPAAEIRFD